MSKPFAGATIDGTIRVVQLCRKDTTALWIPQYKPEWTLLLSVSPNYHFRIDGHKHDANLSYSCGKALIHVKHAGGKLHPVISCISKADVKTGVIPLCLRGTDVLFHLGDNICAEQCFWEKDLDKLAELYITTWDMLPMSHMEHRLIPDDSDFASPELLMVDRKKLDFSAITAFIDTLVYAINGKQRQPLHYYTALYETKHTTYLAISNWVPNEQGKPCFVTNTELVQDLISQYPEQAGRVMLMLSRCTFAITQTLTLHRLTLYDTYQRNASSYLAFAKLKRHWNVDLTVICGDVALPIAFQVTVTHDDKVTSYPMYSTGSFSCHVEEHSPSDFALPCHIGVSLRKIPHCHHLEAGHSYLRIIKHKVHTVYNDHDPMHCASVLAKYLINGVL